MKQFLKELDYGSIMEKAKSNARDLFVCSAFIILYAMIAYPDIKHYSIGSIVSILFIIECSIDLVLTIFGYKKVINIYNKHPIFENFVSYIIFVAIIPIQIPLLKMLLEIPNNPDIVIKIILIWSGVVVGLGVIENFARDFGPKNYIITIGSPGTGKRVNIENKK